MKHYTGRWILLVLATIGIAGYFWYRYHVITGIVYDGPNRLPGAVVRVRGTEYHTVTGEDGTFRLWLPPGLDSVRVTAWKDMYFISGMTLPRNGKPVLFKLRTFQKEDNRDYEWIRPHPDPGSDMACANCHEQIYVEWKRSTHSRSAVNPRMLHLWLETDAEGNTNVPPFGDNWDRGCAGCHIPTGALKNGDAYLPEPGDPLTGHEEDSVHCDFCHKIVSAAVEHESGNSGAMRFKVMRPFENSAFPQLFVGPLDDSEGRDTYSPLYKSSLYCAPCHYWVEDNFIQIFGEYKEWEASDYAKQGIECQDCHMKPSGKMTNFAPPKPGQSRVGIERNPMTLATHDMPGVHDSTFLASAVHMEMDAEQQTDSLLVTVRISNVYAGHHVPTGSPERNMLLLVKAESGGRALKQLGGPVLPDYAGIGNDPNDYAGLPGKGFSRVFYDPIENERLALWWEYHVVELEAEDTRIPSKATDTTSYSFSLEGVQQPATVRATLIYRKAYKQWADWKKWDQKDQIMAKIERILPVGSLAAGRH